jgi:hypothetical protein
MSATLCNRVTAVATWTVRGGDGSVDEGAHVSEYGEVLNGSPRETSRHWYGALGLLIH